MANALIVNYFQHVSLYYFYIHERMRFSKFDDAKKEGPLSKSLYHPADRDMHTS